MGFELLDRIVEIEPGSRIIAVKKLRADEQYLEDHFPNFPVMPGVLMLEAMFQASRWLLLVSDNYERAFVLLREVRNVKFTDFVTPGQELEISATILKDEGSTVTLKVSGTVEGSNAVSGRLILERFNLVDRYPDMGALDAHGRRTYRKELKGLLPPEGQILHSTTSN